MYERNQDGHFKPVTDIPFGGQFYQECHSQNLPMNKY